MRAFSGKANRLRLIKTIDYIFESGGKNMKNAKLIIGMLLVSISLGACMGSSEDRSSEPIGSSKSTESSVGAFVKDSTITSKVESQLLSADDIDSTRISVDADSNGVVVLSGNAKTQAESNRAHEIVHSVDGVKNVINRIEIDKNY